MRLVSALLLGVLAAPALAAQPATLLAPTVVTPAPADDAAAGSAAAAVPAVAANPGAPGQRSRMRDCNAKARAEDVHGAARREFMRSCLSGSSAPSGQAEPPSARPGTAAPPSFPTEAAARAACGQGVVWGNPQRRVYHLAGSRYFGKTKHGVFVCQAAADAAGFHAAGHRAKQAGH